MIDLSDITAASSLLLGFFVLFACIGALRRPGFWQQMMNEVVASPALQLLSALVELLIGVIVYLINPWDAGDILACLMKSLGGLMAAEALMVLGFADIYVAFWLRRLSIVSRSWTWFSLLIGLTFIGAAIPRLS